ncbi:uncharacterized protein LOC126976175 isoform X2 [Leptidea sinapis]|nr:uncharacterized protein LOC126976175 isoform X2 [Leptidea sinapis]
MLIDVAKKKLMERKTETNILEISFVEIVNELWFQYTGLSKISKNTDHMLINSLCMTIADRLKKIVDEANEVKSPCKLSSLYRKAHPHTSDFQFILSTLHMIEDTNGTTHSDISEEELMKANIRVQPYVMEEAQARTACSIYSERMIQKVSEHIKNLNTEESEDKSEEDKARIRVRKQLKRLSPYLETMAKEMAAAHFTPQVSQYYIIHVYGVPCLPPEDVMLNLVRPFKAHQVRRSFRLFNLVTLKARIDLLNDVLKLDGTDIENKCKLIVRPGWLPRYIVPDEIKEHLLSQKENNKYEKELTNDIDIELMNDIEMADDAWEEW